MCFVKKNIFSLILDGACVSLVADISWYQAFRKEGEERIYHLTPLRMTIIKKNTNNKYWWGCGEKRTLMYCWWAWKLVQLQWKTAWRFPKKLKIELPCDQKFYSWVYIWKEKRTNLKRYIHPNVHSSIVYNSQDIEATCVHQQINW